MNVVLSARAHTYAFLLVTLFSFAGIFLKMRKKTAVNHRANRTDFASDQIPAINERSCSFHRFGTHKRCEATKPARKKNGFGKTVWVDPYRVAHTQFHIYHLNDLMRWAHTHTITLMNNSCVSQTYSARIQCTKQTEKKERRREEKKKKLTKQKPKGPAKQQME